MDKDKGGSAFPEIETDLNFDRDAGESYSHTYSYGGMSLRDYLAAKFAAAWVIALSSRHEEAGYADKAAFIEANRLGLLQADAMLKARES